MNILKKLLGFLSVFGVVTKWLPSIGGISGFFGPVGPLIAAALTFVVNLVKWFFEGLTAMLANPVTFITVSAFMIAAFLGGVTLSKEKYERTIARKDQIITTMIEDGKKADAENKLQFEAAKAAKKAAEDEEAARLVAPATTPDKPAPPKRVQPTKRACKDGSGGPGVFGGFPVFGGPAPCVPS